MYLLEVIHPDLLKILDALYRETQSKMIMLMSHPVSMPVSSMHRGSDKGLYIPLLVTFEPVTNSNVL